MSKFLRKAGCYVRRFSGKTSDNGGDRHERIAAAVDPFVPGFVLRKFIDRVEYVALYGWYGPGPSFKEAPPGEIRFMMPAPGFSESEIRLSMINKTRFLLVGKNSEMEHKGFVDLPREKNYEKATFETELDTKGMLHVTVSNFEICDFRVRL